VDKRAEILAFGVALCEQLAGERPFEADDLAETLAAVVKSAFTAIRASLDMRPEHLGDAGASQPNFIRTETNLSLPPLNTK
jgi:hypothetical protein